MRRFWCYTSYEIYIIRLINKSAGEVPPIRCRSLLHGGRTSSAVFRYSAATKLLRRTNFPSSDYSLPQIEGRAWMYHDGAVRVLPLRRASSSLSRAGAKKPRWLVVILWQRWPDVYTIFPRSVSHLAVDHSKCAVRSLTFYIRTLSLQYKIIIIYWNMRNIICISIYYYYYCEELRVLESSW